MTFTLKDGKNQDIPIFSLRFYFMNHVLEKFYYYMSYVISTYYLSSSCYKKRFHLWSLFSNLTKMLLLYFFFFSAITLFDSQFHGMFNVITSIIDSYLFSFSSSIGWKSTRVLCLWRSSCLYMASKSKWSFAKFVSRLLYSRIFPGREKRVR